MDYETPSRIPQKFHYYPVEVAFLCDYFGRPRPERLRNLDVRQPDPVAPDLAIYVQGRDTRPDDLFYEPVSRPLAHAVACLAATGGPDSPPPAYGEEEEEAERKKRSMRTPSLGFWEFLYINWASSAPAFDWPESYFITYFPRFRRWVVVIAQACEDMYGYPSLAIGHCSGRFSPKGAARKIVLAHLSNIWKNFDKEPPAVISPCRFFSTEEAEKLRARAWPDHYKGSKKARDDWRSW